MNVVNLHSNGNKRRQIAPHNREKKTMDGRENLTGYGLLFINQNGTICGRHKQWEMTAQKNSLYPYVMGKNQIVLILSNYFPEKEI